MLIAVAGRIGIWSLRPSHPRRNVLLVTLDTTRADRLSCYGYDRATSPRLDAFAREATRFDLAIAQAANTPVSHASILTGLDPYHHGLRALHGRAANRLPPDRVTLAEVWRSAGGDTAAFVSAYPVTRAFGLDQGFATFDETFLTPGAPPVDSYGIVNAGTNQRRSDETTEAAIEWLNRRSRKAPPFFLWVHYFDPHDPMILPPMEVLERFRPRSGSQEDRLRAVYDGEINFMDSQVGRLLDALKAARLWDDTIVVVIGDHGEGLGDHDWWSHGILYQEEIRVPLIVRIPGRRTPPEVARLARNIDIMPTVLRQAGVDRSRWPKMDGDDLTSLLEGRTPARDRVAYSEALSIITYARPGRKDPDRKSDKLYGIVSDGWKLIYHQLHPGDSELFNLTADPAESRNLYAAEAIQRERLKRLLDSRRALSPLMPDMDEEDYERAERLKSLGYVR